MCFKGILFKIKSEGKLISSIYFIWALSSKIKENQYILIVKGLFRREGWGFGISFNVDVLQLRIKRQLNDTLAWALLTELPGY